MPILISTVLILLDLQFVVFAVIWLANRVLLEGEVLLHFGIDPLHAAIGVVLLSAWILHASEGRAWNLTGGWFARAISGIGRYLGSPGGFGARWALLGIALAWAVALGTQQALAMRFPLWDVGIFHQLIWALGRGEGFHSSISGAGNFLTDHLSLSLILLVPPFLAFGESPLFLAVIHPLLIFAGVAAWVWFAERDVGSGRTWPRRLTAVAAATVVFAIGFDSLWANLRWGFHENSIAFAAASWAFALLLHEPVRKKPAGRAGIALLCWIAALSKEIILLNFAVLFTGWGAAEMAVAWSRLRKGERQTEILKRGVWAGVCLVSAGALVALFIAFEMKEHAPGKNYFNRYYSYYGDDLPSFVLGCLTKPWVAVQTVGVSAMGRYLVDVFLPWLALPLVAAFLGVRAFFGNGRRKRRDIGSLFPAIVLMSILPSLLSALLATFPALKDPGRHYVLELWPALAILSIAAIKEILGLRERWGVTIAWGWSILSLLTLDQNLWRQLVEYASHARWSAEIRGQIRAIPEKAAVLADENAGTWVAGRRWVVQWDQLDRLPSGCPDVILHQGRLSFRRREQVDAIMERCRAEVPVEPASGGGWTLIPVAGTASDRTNP